MIKVLIVEDSHVVREFLVHILSSDPGIGVIGTARDGEEALEAVKHTKPDVITMDIHMPKMNGLDATRRIMETYPTPIVIVSGSQNLKEVETTFKAIEAGALAVVPRPKGLGHPEYEATVRDLIQTVKLMSEVKVVKHWPRTRMETSSPIKEQGSENRAEIDQLPRDDGRPFVSLTRTMDGIRSSSLAPRPSSIAVVAIGASTGGPVILRTILSGLPKDFPVPVMIVQHISPGFIRGFVEWLGRSTGFPVHVASDGESLLPGHAYVAPDDFHMTIKRNGGLALVQEAAENGSRPSISRLFRSVAEVYGDKVIGVLLTGMGRDGVDELKRMAASGAITIVQDEESSVVYGMPGEAIKAGAAAYVLSPEKILSALVSLTKRGERREKLID